MLFPCAQCHRYVRDDEPTCPFCQAEAKPPEIDGGVKRGLSRREMALFAAAAFAGSGCPKKKPPAPPYGAVWPQPQEPEDSVEV